MMQDSTEIPEEESLTLWCLVEIKRLHILEPAGIGG